jgi:hypothetical protein
MNDCVSYVVRSVMVLGGESQAQNNTAGYLSTRARR